MSAEDALVFSSPRPKVSELIKEFERCSPITANWNRFSSNEDIRFCRWSGQSADGKKHDAAMAEGSTAFPFEGASDARTFTIDEVINETVAVEVVAFWRSILRVQGVEAGDIDSSAYAQKLFEWVMGTKQYKDLVREVELHSQYTHTYGWSVLMITWTQEYILKRVKATMAQLLEIAAAAAAQGENVSGSRFQVSGQEQPDGFSSTRNQRPETSNTSVAAALPEMIMDPEMENAVVDLLTQLQPQLTAKRARQAVRDLRNTGEAEVPMPYLCKNEPCIRTLKPWQEIFISNFTNDIQHARVFVKEWLSEVDLRSRIYTDGWDELWVQEAVKHKGECFVFNDALGTTSLSGLDGLSLQPFGDSDLIEVIHCYVKQLDEDNVPGIYCTTLHAGITKAPHAERELYAKHELLEYAHGKMPFVVRKREHLSSTITSSRGLPEILSTTQRSVKVQEDSVTDNTSLGVVPPILVPELEGVDYKFAPAAQIPVRGLGQGREPRFMDVPGGNTKVAFELMDRLERRIDRYTGRVRADEPAQGPQALQQKFVQSNLLSWTEAFQQEFVLLQQFLPADKFQRITGSEGRLADDPDTISQSYDFILTFDVRDLDTDYLQAKLKAIKDMVLPVDAAGRIDRAKLVELLLRAIDPTLAKELIVDKTSASQALFNKVKQDLIGMMAGFEPEYVEMDPTAQTQLQYAQQLLQANPKLQQAMGSDERTQKMFENWAKNRQQSVVQEQNKQVGRIGVQAMQ